MSSPARKSPRKHASTSAAPSDQPLKRIKTAPSASGIDPVVALLLLKSDDEPDAAAKEKAGKYLARCEQKLGAAKFVEWLAVLARHHDGTIDTKQAVDGALCTLVDFETKNTALVLQLNNFLPKELRLNFALAWSAAEAARKAAGAAPAGAAPARKAAAAAPAAPVAAAAAASEPAGAAASGDDMLAHLTEPGWRTVLSRELGKPYFQRIVDHVAKERRAGKTIFPPADKVFSAFNWTPFDDIKVVIIGQDPCNHTPQSPPQHDSQGYLSHTARLCVFLQTTARAKHTAYASLSREAFPTKPRDFRLIFDCKIMVF